MVTVPLTGRVERLLLSRLISVSAVQLHRLAGSSVSLLYLAGQTDRQNGIRGKQYAISKLLYLFSKIC